MKKRKQRATDDNKKLADIELFKLRSQKEADKDATNGEQIVRKTESSSGGGGTGRTSHGNYQIH